MAGLLVSSRPSKEQAAHGHPLQHLPSLPRLLAVMESALLQRTHQPHLLAYRDMHPIWVRRDTDSTRHLMAHQRAC